jgi:hypothetical protein
LPRKARPNAASVLARAPGLARAHSLPESEAAAWNDIGSAKYYPGNYTHAHACFTKALDVLERQKSQNPERSRVALSAPHGQNVEYLFAREIHDLDLKGVRLATLPLAIAKQASPSSERVWTR